MYVRRKCSSGWWNRHVEKGGVERKFGRFLHSKDGWVVVYKRERASKRFEKERMGDDG
jgi:hypothetical protein